MPARPALAEFESALAAEDSATVAIGKWCAAHRLGAPATIRAIPVVGGEVAPSKEVLVVLGISGGEALGYRHVRLLCGDTVLSEARNWYVPSRLSPDMNHALATTQEPFGKVVAPLRFTRERRASVHGRSNFCPEGTILSHSALLRLPDGKPLSVLTECYTAANLGGR